MSQYAALADKYAQQYGIDPKLFRALVTQESGWNPRARSHVGAYGLTQAMPATARQPGHGVTPLRDIDNPAEQLRFGAEYFRAMLDYFDGDVKKALAAYNAGAGTVEKAGGVPKIKETQDYVAKILGNAGGASGSEGLGRAPQMAAGLDDGYKTHGPDGVFGDRYGNGSGGVPDDLLAEILGGGVLGPPPRPKTTPRQEMSRALAQSAQRLLNG